jgi:hypothetical protein
MEGRGTVTNPSVVLAVAYTHGNAQEHPDKVLADTHLPAITGAVVVPAACRAVHAVVQAMARIRELSLVVKELVGEFVYVVHRD